MVNGDFCLYIFIPLHIDMFACLFLEQEDDARVKKAFQTLLTYVGNVARNPDEEKFRKIRLNNPAFQVRKSANMVGLVFREFLLCHWYLWRGKSSMLNKKNRKKKIVKLKLWNLGWASFQGLRVFCWDRFNF